MNRNIYTQKNHHSKYFHDYNYQRLAIYLFLCIILKFSGFCRGRKAIPELPRSAKTLTAAKAIATRYLGYKPDWKAPAEQQEVTEKTCD